ncbi:deleted in malignant brain tumors 1 protein-like [Pomacea canaliculata]|nr:deleted in malignant brain tumors 1 protein-like [Pomacea canaliculata]
MNMNTCMASQSILCLLVLAQWTVSCHGQTNFFELEDLNVTECEDFQNKMIIELEGQLKDVELSLAEVERNIVQLTDAQTWETNVKDLLENNEGLLKSLFDEVTSKDAVKSRRAACVLYSERVRLVNGHTPAEGRVEVWIGSTWSPLAENLYRKKEADVVCTALGYNGLNAAPTSYVIFGESSDTTNVLSPINCQHSAGAICNPLAEDIRLVGGQNRFEGRVEIRVNGQWGAVCDDAWETNDAKVVCNALGMGQSGAAAAGNSLFGRSADPVLLRGLRCGGTESHLLSCQADRIVGAASDCSASSEAGVICGDFLPYPVRLVGGSSQLEGRVEIRAFNEWGTVNRNGFDNADASVICRMLGYSPQGATAVRDLRFGAGHWASMVGRPPVYRQ